MGQWVGSGHITKNQINLELIKIIQFCLKICDLLRHPHLWMGRSMAGARSNTKYRINLDLIERIQFCLKIYDGSKGRSMGRLMSNH